jgi:hypothetical protein
MAEKTFAVALTEPIDASNAELLNSAADIYAEVFGIIKYDALAKIRSAIGILIEEISNDRATALADRLNNINISCIAIDGSKFPKHVQAEFIKEISVTEDHFNVAIGQGKMAPIQWADLQMLSTCFFKKTLTEIKKRQKSLIHHVTGLAVKGAYLSVGPFFYKSYSTMKENMDSRFTLNKVTLNEFYIADFLLVNPFRKLRLYSNACRYDYLGDRLREKAEENFQSMISDIC